LFYRNELAGQTVFLTLSGEMFDGRPINGQDSVLLLDNVDRECHADFDCDTDVDGSDALTFKRSFGRSRILNPCSEENICDGDFDADGDGDGMIPLISRPSLERFFSNSVVWFRWQLPANANANGPNPMFNG
jgi:hypothetical protein